MREQISFINDGDKKYLVYEAGENARKNNISLHMPEYNDIPQLLHMYPAEGRELKVNYDITGLTSLMDSFPNEAGRDDVLPVLQKLLFTIKALRMQFITEEDLLLQKEYIYVQSYTMMLNFAATPDIGEGRSIAALFQDIIDTVNWKKEEDKSYLTTLGEVLSREDITNEEIHTVLKEILQTPVQYLALEPETSQLNAYMPEPEVPSQPEVAPQPEVPQPPQAVYTPQPEVPQPPQTAYAPQPEVQPEPAYGVSGGEYTQEFQDDDDEDSFGETTVLGATTHPMIFPSLVRLKTNERVVINKMEFIIGKDPSKVDYCIFDNSAVSRVHAKIICKNGEFFVIDNRSTNHVYVNGILIDANVEVRLSHGSHIRLGDEDFEFRFQ